ncbi:hypothetical protein ApNV_066 [Aratus pisonii nudivirus]|nr:hypothetical protein ApNV_066 [Aratus pisonii nudivirus]
MFIDELSYIFKVKRNKRTFDLLKLKTGIIHRYSFYSSDTKGYTAISYEFIINPDKTYEIIKFQRYSSPSTSVSRSIKQSLLEYIKQHKKENYIFAISNCNIRNEYPESGINKKTMTLKHKDNIKDFKIHDDAQHIQVVKFSIPVENLFENKPNNVTYHTDILRSICNYYKYNEL